MLITADDQTVEGEYSDGTLSVEMDGLSVVLSQEKEEYVPYVPGKPVAEPKLEDFNGDWTSTLIDLYGMQMPATGEIAGVEMKMSITDGNATLVLLEEGNETTTELKGVMEENALIFNAETQKEETETDSENYHLFSTDTMRFYLLEDGKLCFTTADCRWKRKQRPRLRLQKNLKMAKMISVVLISRSTYIWIKFWNNRKSGSPVFSQWKQGTSLVSKGGFRKWDYLTKRIVISAVIK